MWGVEIRYKNTYRKISLEKFTRNIEVDRNADLNEAPHNCQDFWNTSESYGHINEI